ncbi:hypothetical protein CSOJ01_12384 [Colletotrichum sojae]|uniref:Uncharacterized protein n=1 Tax=Colletotrichum sojae TaxID=2175907 RepID=A0A8H6IVY4_9PEZI|nr:hypothetical protein CSOJ01_12384 [Colletotrichum sojae]
METTPNSGLGDKKSFRLLEIKGADKFSDPLCGTLKQFQLPILDANAPRYWFLTYDTTQAVSSDGLQIELASSQNGRQVKEIYVSDNFGQALQYLRPKSKSGTRLLLWVESLCHTDIAGLPKAAILGGAIPVEEKTTIPSIIQRADATIAWLGLGRPPAAIPSDKKRIRLHNETQWEVGHSKDMALMNLELDLSRLKGHDQQRQVFETSSESRANDWPVFSNAFVRENLFRKHFPSLIALRISRLVMFIQGGFACPDYRLSSLRSEGSIVVPAEILPTLRLATQLLPMPASAPVTPDQASARFNLLPGENEGTQQSHLHHHVRPSIVQRHDELVGGIDVRERESLMTYIVREAAVAQDIFGERATSIRLIGEKKPTCFCGKGYLASKVEFVGTSHEKFRWSPTAAKLEKWAPKNPSGALCYTKLSLNYAHKELRFLQSYDRPPWPFPKGLGPSTVAAWAWDHSLEEDGEPQTLDGESKKSIGRYTSPVYFSGTNGCVGLAPASTIPGDYVVKFRGCDATLIFRSAVNRPHWSAVGRADVIMPGEPLSRRDVIEMPNRNDLENAYGVEVRMG